MLDTPLPEQAAALAESIVNTLTQTKYQYAVNIIPSEGIYDCDCNGFILNAVAPQHYAMIEAETVQPHPRAYVYFEFFAALTPQSTSGWHRVDLLMDAVRGDIISWRSPAVAVGSDTGHVLFVAEAPTLDASGVYIVRVYDSANVPHFEDTRAAGTNGVGSGFINFQVDGEGRPILFCFAPGDVFTTFPIMIARLDTLPANSCAMLQQVRSDGPRKI